MAWQLRGPLTQEEVDQARAYYLEKYGQEADRVHASSRDWPPKDPVTAVPNVHVSSGSLLLAHPSVKAE